MDDGRSIKTDTMIGSPPPMHKRIASASRQIWNNKYRFGTADGTPVDGAIEDTWRRIARALAVVEKEPGVWKPWFHEAPEDFRFLPAGRTAPGAGTGRRVALFNCFVTGDVGDGLGSIVARLRAGRRWPCGRAMGSATTSPLRSRSAAVKGVGADASGPLSVVDVWDSMCRTIMAPGARCGAMMATLRCDHPDIEDFVAAKRNRAGCATSTCRCW